jgi:hypothetical protein
VCGSTRRLVYLAKRPTQSCWMVSSTSGTPRSRRCRKHLQCDQAMLMSAGQCCRWVFLERGSRSFRCPVLQYDSRRGGGKTSSIPGTAPTKHFQALDPQQRLLLEVCYETLENGKSLPVSDIQYCSLTGWLVSRHKSWQYLWQ